MGVYYNLTPGNQSLDTNSHQTHKHIGTYHKSINLNWFGCINQLKLFLSCISRYLVSLLDQFIYLFILSLYLFSYSNNGSPIDIIWLYPFVNLGKTNMGEVKNIIYWNLFELILDVKNGFVCTREDNKQEENIRKLFLLLINNIIIECFISTFVFLAKKKILVKWIYFIYSR